MTQRARLKHFFEDRANQWIPLPEILDLGIAQYGARVLELRRSGMDIKNKWKVIDGIKYSWFMYIPQERQLVIPI